MAYFDFNKVSVTAGADLSAATKPRFLKVDNTGRYVLAGSGERALAVMTDTPRGVVGAAVAVVLPGTITKVEASAAISAGANVTSAANGKVVTAATGNIINGVALEDATAAGDVISVQTGYFGASA